MNQPLWLNILKNKKKVIIYISNVVKEKKGGKGKCKFQIKNKKWFLVEKYNDKIIHDIFNYEQFNIDYYNKNHNYNMEKKKYQEYYTLKILNDNFNIKSYNGIYYKKKWI